MGGDRGKVSGEQSDKGRWKAVEMGRCGVKAEGFEESGLQHKKHAPYD